MTWNKTSDGVPAAGGIFVGLFRQCAEPRILAVTYSPVTRTWREHPQCDPHPCDVVPDYWTPIPEWPAEVKREVDAARAKYEALAALDAEWRAKRRVLESSV